MVASKSQQNTFGAYLRHGLPGKGSETPHLLAGVRALGLTVWPAPFAYAQGNICFSSMSQGKNMPADRAPETAATPLSVRACSPRRLESHANLCPCPATLRKWDTALIKFARAARLTLEQLTDTQLAFPLLVGALRQFFEAHDWLSGRRLYLGAFVRLNYRPTRVCHTFGDPNGPTALDGALHLLHGGVHPSSNTIAFQSIPQRRKGVVELILFHAPSNVFARIGFLNYLLTDEMARLVTVSSSVHKELMNTVTESESRTNFDLLACHLKVISLLRWRPSSLECLLQRYVKECGATSFSDWLEQETQQASREGWFYDGETNCLEDEYGVEIGSPVTIGSPFDDAIDDA
jgi:hypothetical protein